MTSVSVVGVIVVWIAVSVLIALPLARAVDRLVQSLHVAEDYSRPRRLGETANSVVVGALRRPHALDCRLGSPPADGGRVWCSCAMGGVRAEKVTSVRPVPAWVDDGLGAGVGVRSNGIRPALGHRVRAHPHAARTHRHSPTSGRIGPSGSRSRTSQRRPGCW